MSAVGRGSYRRVSIGALRGSNSRPRRRRSSRPEITLRVTGTYWRGRANAGKVQVRRNIETMDNLAAILGVVRNKLDSSRTLSAISTKRSGEIFAPRRTTARATSSDELTKGGRASEFFGKIRFFNMR